MRTFGFACPNASFGSSRVAALPSRMARRWAWGCFFICDSSCAKGGCGCWYCQGLANVKRRGSDGSCHRRHHRQAGQARRHPCPLQSQRAGGARREGLHRVRRRGGSRSRAQVPDRLWPGQLCRRGEMGKLPSADGACRRAAHGGLCRQDEGLHRQPGDPHPAAGLNNPISEVHMAIKLYSWPHSSGTRVAWALEELGLAYEFVNLDAKRQEHRKPEYLAVNPHGKVPALVDGNQAFFESGAILLHLGTKYGVEKNLFPAGGSQARADAISWIVWAVAEFGPYMMQYLYHG